MEKLNMEEMKQNSGASEKGYSFIQLIVGAVMVGVGYQYLWVDSWPWDQLQIMHIIDHS